VKLYLTLASLGPVACLPCKSQRFLWLFITHVCARWLCLDWMSDDRGGSYQLEGKLRRRGVRRRPVSAGTQTSD
jgi:hypothetical protein